MPRRRCAPAGAPRRPGSRRRRARSRSSRCRRSRAARIPPSHSRPGYYHAPDAAPRIRLRRGTEDEVGGDRRLGDRRLRAVSVPAEAAGGDDERERGLPARERRVDRGQRPRRGALRRRPRGRHPRRLHPRGGPDRGRPAPDQRRRAQLRRRDRGRRARDRRARPPISTGCWRSSTPFQGPICGAEPIATAGDSGEAAPTEAPAAVSADGSTALLLIRTNTEDSEEIQDNVDALREIAPDPDAGEGELRAYVTGIGGIVSDSIEVFESIDTTLLLVTVGLVLVLAAGDLPLAGDRAGAAVRGRDRLRDRRRARLRPGRGGGARGQRPDHQPVDRPDVRRRHRLLPVDRLPLPRGAATVRGQARGDGACHRAHRAGDPLGRRDRDRRDAGAHARRLQRHPDDGTGAGAGRRRDAARGPHPPARAAGGARAQLLLAGDPAPRQRAAGCARDLAPGRALRPRAPDARARDLGRDPRPRRAGAVPGPRHHRLRRGLSRSARVGRRPARDRGPAVGRPDRGHDRPRRRRRRRAGGGRGAGGRRRRGGGPRRDLGGRRARADRRDARLRPVLRRGQRHDPGPARGGPGGRGRRRGAGRRADGGELRHHRDPALGREADRAAGPAADLRHPLPAPARGRRAALPGRDGGPLLRLRARRDDADLHRDLQPARLGPGPADLRLHLPGRARGRLQHLLDEPDPRGGRPPGDQGGGDHRARADRRRDHQRRADPRRAPSSRS